MNSPINNALRDAIIACNKRWSRYNYFAKKHNLKQAEYYTGRQFLQCIGFDSADKLGALEEYKDAWGVNFLRPSDAWDKLHAANYDHLARYFPPD